MQKIMRNKGITLVALVVTIVIMLILAGVTIGLVTGENGLFKMAQQGVDKYKTSQKNEESTMQGIADELQGLIGKGKDDKTPGIIDGEGTEEKPFVIESIEDLVQFSNNVNAGTTYENQIVKLAVNLDFQSEDSYVDSKNKTYGDINGANGAEELKTELTTGTGFTSIGNYNHRFKGTFDAQNRTISNLYINIAEDYKGLFGYVDTKGTIKNLTISNSYINCEAIYIGALAGCVNGGTIENIKTINGKLIGNQSIGGIVGCCENQSTINNCINSNNVTANGLKDTTSNSNVGGITGLLRNSKILNSCNSGNIDVKKGRVIGGIVGEAASNSIIASCYNEGRIGNIIEENDNSQVGGIAGSLTRKTKVSKCYNIEKISGENQVGGIAGIMGWESEAYIENCYNSGIVELTSETGMIGGISTVFGSTTGSEIRNCYNVGNIIVKGATNDRFRQHCRNRQ